MTMATSHLLTSILPRQQAMTVTPDFGDIKDNGEKCNATQREKERERERLLFLAVNSRVYVVCEQGRQSVEGRAQARRRWRWRT